MVHMVRRFGLPLKLIDQGEPDQNTMTRLYCSFLKAWAIGGILDRDPEPSTSPRQPPRGQSGQGEARHRSTLEGDVATALDSAAAEGDGWPDRLFFGFIALWAREWTHYTCWEVARTQGATRGQEGVRSDSASNALEALLADWGTSDHRAFIVKCRNAVDDLARFLSVEESVDLVDNVDHCVKTCLKLENEFFRAVTAEVS